MVSNTPETRAVAEVVQSMAAEAGFDLKLRVTEVATALKQGEDGDFQLYMNTWSGRIDPDGNSVIYQTCGAPQNMGHYCDKEVDAWHQEARAASDPASRKAAYEKITAQVPGRRLDRLPLPPAIPDRAHRPARRVLSRCPTGCCAVVGLRLK